MFMLCIRSSAASFSFRRSFKRLILSRRFISSASSVSNVYSDCVGNSSILGSCCFFENDMLGLSDAALNVIFTELIGEMSCDVSLVEPSNRALSSCGFLDDRFFPAFLTGSWFFSWRFWGGRLSSEVWFKQFFLVPLCDSAVHGFGLSCEWRDEVSSAAPKTVPQGQAVHTLPFLDRGGVFLWEEGDKVWLEVCLAFCSDKGVKQHVLPVQSAGISDCMWTLSAEDSVGEQTSSWQAKLFSVGTAEHLEAGEMFVELREWLSRLPSCSSFFLLIFRPSPSSSVFV